MARTYETIRLESRYAPWRDDEAFQRVYTQIKSSTLIDECRCWNLWRLVEQSSKLEGGHLIEIGVWRGGSGILIATQAAMCGIWDMVFLCDTFSGVVKAGPQDAVYRGGEHADTSLAAVTDLVVHHNLHNVITVAGPMPESWVDCGYSDFRFCHIDVDVYQSAKECFEWVWPMILRGGIVVFDDFGFKTCGGVAQLVDEVTGMPDAAAIYNLSGQAVFIKTE